MYKALIIFIVLAIGLSSCGETPYYQEKHSFSNQTWEYTDLAKFNFSITDTSQIYSLGLEIGHSQEYKWENLYTEIETVFPSGEKKKQLVSLELANNFGQWEGEGSNPVVLDLVLQNRVRFDEQGAYQINIKQYMREDAVEGVEYVELVLRLME